MVEETNQANKIPDEWVEFLHDPEIVESGGSHNNEGVDFARYWAIAVLLALEEAGASDYAIVFECVQDVMVLESATTPKTAHLYQVKKRERGSWTQRQLCRRTPSYIKGPARRADLKGKSVLGKLYLAIEKVSQALTAQGTFVSNAVCDVKTASGAALPPYATTCINALHKIERESIETSLARELKKKKPLKHLGALHLEHTKISPGAMRDTVRGMADDYIVRNLPQASNVAGQLIEHLFSAFSSVSGPRPGLRHLSEVINAKGYTRRQFTDLLGRLAKIRPFPVALESAIAGLKFEGMAARAADHLHAETVRVKTEMIRHPQVKQAFQWDAAVTAAQSCKGAASYTESVNAIVVRIRRKAKESGIDAPSEDTCKAVALLAIEHVDQELTPPNPQSPDKRR